MSLLTDKTVSVSPHKKKQTQGVICFDVIQKFIQAQSKTQKCKDRKRKERKMDLQK
jgi:hypothetical protein